MCHDNAFDIIKDITRIVFDIIKLIKSVGDNCNACSGGGL